MGFLKVGFDLVIPASVPADESLSDFVHNFINIFSISSGYRQTE
jgi:hypothetical protein